MSAIPQTKPPEAAYSGERKKWGIRAARKPQKYHDLAGVVIVKSGLSTYAANIRFDASLVDAVGNVMPRGVGPEDQVYLEVRQTPVTLWEVWAVYIRSLRERKLLWVQAEKPPWIT